MSDENTVLQQPVQQPTQTHILQCPVAATWGDHYRKASIAMEQVNVMHSTMAQIVGYTQHLTKLDDIARGFGQFSNRVETLDKNMVGPATSKNQVPLWAFIVMFGIMSALNLFTLARESNKEIRISKERGLEITQPPESEKDAVNTHKTN